MSLTKVQLKSLHSVTLGVAAQSLCNKRKVGAVITNTEGLILATGFNQTIDGTPCEDATGRTMTNVAHAEAVAILKLEATYPDKRIKGYIFVTHPPCASCQSFINNHDLEVIIVENFMKFDEDKQRFDLLPLSVAAMYNDNSLMQHCLFAQKQLTVRDKSYALLILAKFVRYEAGVHPANLYAVIQRVLEYGAKKYKPENWRQVEDLNRYWNALGRHVLAMDNGEHHDTESGILHASHALTNIAFLIELLNTSSAS